ncbi:MAG: energy-coupling factor transporter transmembrane component T [Clostridium sp.]|nr:energy-coupling factor transporter transmembrane component T [Clostridium sp.]
MEAEWLFQKDDYTPIKDQEKFVDRSIFSIINILGRIKRRGNYSTRPFYKLNATLKVVFTFINIILLALSRNFVFIIALYIYLLTCIITLEKEEIEDILLISFVIPIFTLIMLIPSLLSGNIINSALILIKVASTILSVNILSYTTKWEHITKALKLLFIPDLFIWVMEITIKYIVILGEHSLNMLYALKLRSIGKNNKKYNSLSRLMGNLFLKSKEMGEEMFSAMECRGFTGEYKSLVGFKADKYDIIYCIVNIAFIVAFIVI